MFFTLLGPVGAWRDGHQVALGTPQQRSVLANLLVRGGEMVSADELVQGLWGELPPPGATGTVRTYVSRLRRALAPVDIATVAGGYVLRAPAQNVDLAMFREHLARAREERHAGRPAAALAQLGAADRLWTGSPLAGLPGDFAQAQRVALAQLKAAADLERLELELALDPARVDLTRLAGLVAAQPLHERPRELLMLALAGCGRRAEALAVFAAGRDLLADRLGVDPGPGLLRTHRRVLDGAVGPGTESPAATAAAHPVPAQLPPDLADFTGRGMALRLLTEPGEESPAAIVGIVGAPGVGTSSVAIRAAHQLRAAYPDGQLYADLRGAGPDQVDAVLATFLRSYGHTGPRLPRSRTERAALWRRCLAGRRVLMLLDHGCDAAGMTALAPAVPGCLTIVTGHRRRADLGAVRWLDLRPFSADEGLALLERIAGRHRIRAELDAARRLVASCGGRPLRVRMAAERIASRPDWTLDTTASTPRQSEVGSRVALCTT